MAGFSLGGSQIHLHRQGYIEEDVDVDVDAESLFLYNGAAARAFELWQHHQRQQQLYSASTAGSTLLAFGGSDEPIGPGPTRSCPRESGGGKSCQDCGNQAKKDCAHMRCRTCCKSGGFHCPIHVKSTWVPAAKRQKQLAAVHQQHQLSPFRHRVVYAGGETSKRPRDLSTTVISNTTSGGSKRALSFPAEMSSAAVFRCVRVRRMSEAKEQLAYQTAVSIGGHVFKGILYDQGPEPLRHHRGGASSATAGSSLAISASSAAAGTSALARIAGLLPGPSALYSTAPLTAFKTETQFFPHHPSRP